MPLLYVDISEKKYVKDAAIKYFGEENVGVKELGCYDCGKCKIPMCKPHIATSTTKFCAEDYEVETMEKAGFVFDKSICKECEHAEYVRFADFEIAEGRAFIERKQSPDFLSSRRDRLYEQLDKLDTFVQGRKILLLEGTKREAFVDSSNFFSNYDKKTHDLRGMSPLEQCVDIAGSKEWTYSFIRECFMRDILFLQSWDLNETMIILDNMIQGFDETPKLRMIPKRMPKFPVAQTMLSCITGIGKVHSFKLLNDHGSIEGIIKDLKKVKEKNKDQQKLYDILTKKVKPLK